MTNTQTYTDPDGHTHVQTGAYALPFAVLVRDAGTGPWGFYGTHGTYQAASRRLAEAHRRGGFDSTNSVIVEADS